jgi:predicted AAA+ superfamily ATPase
MADPPLFQRFSAEHVKAALKDTPVVMVNGPRQSGKTTLVRQFAAADRAYVTLDDETVLQAARSDPAGFIRDLDRAIIDEVQRIPELLRAVKRSVDEDRRPGRFLLTGSANILTLPRVSESLAGRMEIVNLLPLSRAEIRDRKPTFLKNAMSGKLVKPPETVIAGDLVEAVLTGGYPEMVKRRDARRRQAWARDYIRAIVQRDVRDIAEVEKLDILPRLLRVLGHHSGQIGGQIGLDDKTTRKYVSALEQLFLVHRVEPWFGNQLKRLVKTAKLHFLDSGLLAAMLGITAERIARDRALLGPLLESFVFSEVMKQCSWLDGACAIHHYRDKDQDEVDLVAESHEGALVGIEIKAAATVISSDFKGLRKLRDASAKDFRLGVVLYDGELIVPFGEHMFAAPMACVWG